jgi:hypothetical protein
MLRHTGCLLLPLLLAGCVCGPVGTLAARRTVTPTAEVVDVYGVGLWLRARAADTGVSFGWRHVTYIHPRVAGDGAEEGSRWSFGYAAVRREAPFFLAARGVGVEVTHYPGFTRAHAGYAADAFTFAAKATESRSVSFHYRSAFPEDTRLAMNPAPPIHTP